MTRETIEDLHTAVTNIYSIVDSGIRPPFYSDEAKAYTTKIYLVHKFWDKEDTDTIGFNTRLNHLNKVIRGNILIYLTEEVTEFSYYLVNGRTPFSSNLFLPRIDLGNSIGCELIVGTKYDGLILPAIVGPYKITYRFEVMYDSLKISVRSGSEARDITEAFEVVTVTNNGTLTPLETMAKGLSLISNIAGGAFQVASGGAGIISGSAQIGSTFAHLIDHKNGTYIPGGSGYATYADVLNNNGGYPLLVGVRRNDNINESHTTALHNVQYRGAMCDYYPAWDTELFEFINDRDSLLNETPFVFLACECTVKNIPYNAAAEIQSLLADGVRFHKIT